MAPIEDNLRVYQDSKCLPCFIVQDGYPTCAEPQVIEHPLQNGGTSIAASIPMLKTVGTESPGSCD
jgi:hypothetical protein